MTLNSISLNSGGQRERCARSQLGSCRGCDVAQRGIDAIRWNGIDMNDVIHFMAQNVCPTGLIPLIDDLVNKDASYGLGQRREENLTGLQNLGAKPSRLKPGRKKQLSKSDTGRWYQD